MQYDGYLFDFEKLPIHEIGASLLTLLLYPRAEKQKNLEEQRDRVYQAFCGAALKEYAKDKVWSGLPKTLIPEHLAMSELDIRKGLKTYRRRLRDRMNAGRLAMAFIMDVEGTLPDLEIGRASLNQLIPVLFPNVSQSAADNFETRVWRPSIPVIHLTAAIQMVLSEIEEFEGKHVSVGDILIDRELIERLVQKAELYEQRLLESQAEIDPAALIRIRLAV